MAKAILMSIKPKYVSLILNKIKTIEIRKRFPADYVGWVYIYCTKGKQNLLYSKSLDYYALEVKHDDVQNALSSYEVNSKVVARFYCDKVELIRPIALGSFLTTLTLKHREIIDKSCLTENEIRRYLTDMYGYAIHITKLEIFDKPKELYEFDSLNGIVPCDKCLLNLLTCKCNHCNSIYKAPQNYCYIEENEL